MKEILRGEIMQVPKYTIEEIKHIINSTSSDYGTSELMKKSVWTATDYKKIALITKIPLEELMSFIPEEELSSVSFRALNNSSEVTEKVSELNDIFEYLLYQIKVGRTND